MSDYFKYQGSSQAVLGHIPYLNLMPFYQELQKLLPQGFGLESSHPSEINRRLRHKEILAAPASSICLLKYPELEMLAPLGVCSSSEVLSVYIGFDHQSTALFQAMQQRIEILAESFRSVLKQNPDNLKNAAHMIWSLVDDLDPIAKRPPLMVLSRHSATSVALAKFIYRICFGEQALFTRAVVDQESHHFENELTHIEVVIGDEALEKRSQFANVLDLGEVWQKLTGLPFVYAVWQFHNGFQSTMEDTDFTSLLHIAGEKAQSRMHVEPQYYLQEIHLTSRHNLESILPEYWKNIRYKLNATDVRGLILYLNLMKPMLKNENTESWSVKSLRLQDRFAHSLGL